MRHCSFLACLLFAIPENLAHVRLSHELHSGSVFLGLAWSPDGREIATDSNWGGTYTVWTAAGTIEREFEHQSDLPLYGNSIAFLGAASYC